MATLTVTPTNEYVELWKEIYQGCPIWRETHYQTLEGRKEKRNRKLFYGAKMVCREFTDLMFSEKPDINMSDDLEAILERSGWDQNNIPFIEKVLALGGGAYKLYTKDIKGQQQLCVDYIPADRFMPISWDDNGICEADFLDIKVKDNLRYMRIEHHRYNETKTGYIITYDFYKIGEPTGGNKSKRQLTKVTPKEAGYNVTDEELRGVEVITDYPLFSYIKLPGANNKDFESPLSISVYANSIDTLEGLDVAFDAFQQEIVLGRKRIIVPSSAVRKVVNEDGKRVHYFDPSDEVFQAFDTDDKESLKIVDNSMVLRIDDLRNAVQTYLDILSVQVGFSAGHLSFDGTSGVKTATEVIMDNSKTHKSKVAIENSIKVAIENLVKSIEGVSQYYKINVSNFSIEFQDNIQEDRDSKTNYWTSRLNEGTITLEEFLMKVDNLTEEEANKKAGEIKEKNATGNINNSFQVDI